MPVLNTRKIVTLALIALTATTHAASKQAREDDLKAVFLFNFAQFVDWPPGAFENETAPFVIGVLGESPVADSLLSVITNETVRGRPIVIRHFESPPEVTGVHILFVGRSEASRLGQIIQAVNGKSILTVGETEGFAEQGGVIGFVIAKSKLQVKINADAAKDAQLVISSKLLRQAEIISAKQGS